MFFRSVECFYFVFSDAVNDFGDIDDEALRSGIEVTATMCHLLFKIIWDKVKARAEWKERLAHQDIIKWRCDQMRELQKYDTVFTTRRRFQ